MSEIEIGEYVRDIDGKIYKADNIFLKHANIVVKTHSKSIIDLIEVGDFVNGFPVMEPIYNGNVWWGVDEGYEQFKRAFGDIKTILTHEQYEQNCYKLKE